MYRIEGDALIFSNGKRIQLDNQIVETVDFEDSLVIRVSAEPFLTTENVYSFDFAGNLLWQIPPSPYVHGCSPYVGLWRKDHDFVEAYNWNGFAVVLHPKVGTVLNAGQSFADAPSTKRTPSRRVWL
jgi:hypothetical protein